MGSRITSQLTELIELLESIAIDRGALSGASDEERERLLQAVARIYHPDRAERRRRKRVTARERRAERLRANEGTRDQTGIRTLRRKPVFHTPNVFPPPAFAPHDRHNGDLEVGETIEPQSCYICKRKYTQLHHFYDQLCPSCAEVNFRKRTELADLRGRVALLTGGRVKIGYQAGLKLLRSGAHVIVTTRFPRDAAMRFAREHDFADWRDRVEVFGLDLRHTPSVEAFCQYLLGSVSRLDFIVNNACQTVRRPPEFYAHMMQAENAALSQMPQQVRALLGGYEGLRGYHMLPEVRLRQGYGGQAPDLTTSGLPPDRDPNERRSAVPVDPKERRSAVPVDAALDVARASELAGLTHAPQLSQVPLLADDQHARNDLFPEGVLDQDLQQVDLRGRNSWRLLLAEVPTVELLEVHLVNAVAPFILNARLKPLMLRTPERDKHIVNVSAVEGQFYRTFKTTKHPHTNMAKAALNMMTRTAATDYHHDGIHMNSVDTGWVTDEDPAHIAARKTAEHRFHPPLDIVDGAARIVDPIISGFNTGHHVWGKFLKDYEPTDW